VAEAPDTTEVGAIVKLVSVGAFIVRFTPIEELPRVPVILATVLVATGVVVAGNVAFVAPAAMVTGLVTVAATLLDARAMLSPPVGAALEMVTVPVEPTPPITVVLERLTVLSAGAVMVRAANFFEVPALADMVAVAFFARATVFTVKLAVVALAATFALAGTVADVLDEDSVTTTPLAGAAAERVIVPLALLPPATLAGDSVTLEIDWPKATNPEPRNPTSTANRKKFMASIARTVAESPCVHLRAKVPGWN